MIDSNKTRQCEILRSLAALPLATMFFPTIGTVAQTSKLVVFNGVHANFDPGIDVHVFSWAAETPQGWIGLEGNKDTGEFTYTLRGGGKDNVFKMKGRTLVS